MSKHYIIALMKLYVGLLDHTVSFLNVFYYTVRDKSETKKIKNI